MGLMAALCLLVLWLRRRRRFAFRPDAGAYYFADGCLVLNYRLPEAHPLASIAWVEFSLRDADHTQEDLQTHVLLRNGRKYSYRFRNAPPGFGKHWQTELEAAGVRCLWI